MLRCALARANSLRRRWAAAVMTILRRRSARRFLPERLAACRGAESVKLIQSVNKKPRVLGGTPFVEEFPELFGAEHTIDLTILRNGGSQMHQMLSSMG